MSSCEPMLTVRGYLSSISFIHAQKQTPYGRVLCPLSMPCNKRVNITNHLLIVMACPYVTWLVLPLSPTVLLILNHSAIQVITAGGFTWSRVPLPHLVTPHTKPPHHLPLPMPISHQQAVPTDTLWHVDLMDTRAFSFLTGRVNNRTKTLLSMCPMNFDFVKATIAWWDMCGRSYPFRYKNLSECSINHFLVNTVL